MSTVVRRRPPRRPEPEYPSGEVLLEAPPEVPAPTGRGWAQMLMMIPMLAGSGSMALMFAGQRGGPLAYLTGAMFGLSAVGMLASQFGQNTGPGRQEMLLARRNYMRHLAQRRRQVRKAAQRQRASQLYRYPDPSSLWSIPTSQRLWERRPGDADFGMVRIALGPQDLATPLVPPQSQPLDDLDPMCAVALRKFMDTYATVDDLPIVMALDGFARVYVQGEPDQARALARAVIAQSAAFHAPDDLLVAVCAAPGGPQEWEWLKWLPHGLHPSRTDALGPLRLVAPNVPGLEAMLDDVLANRPRFNPTSAGDRQGGPHLIVVLDGGDVLGSDHLMTDGGVEGVTVLDLSTSPPRLLDQAALVLSIAPGGMLTSTTFEGKAEVGRADGLSLPETEGLALQLSPLRLSAASRTEQRTAGTIDLADLLEIGSPEDYDPGRHWVPRPQRDRLRVPIGWSPDGTMVELDLKESAQDGMGPHGLLIGATGSGKSELLRTLVLALAVTHSSEVLNFVLIDFKGGATFTKLDVLPHTSAVITNLEDELPLVDRMTDAINGELLRRQELLRKAGNFASQRDYEKARTAGASLAPLPSLLIICDEFSELLTAKPDFIDMFVQIGRVGRSLGVHLLLASQRLEEGRLRGLDTHLSYRIGLRTFSAVESRIVLGDVAAFELPRSPGHGYLRFGTEPLRRFRAAYVSGVYRRDSSAVLAASGGPQVRDYVSGYIAPPVTEEPVIAVPDENAVGESMLDILVDRMRGKGTPAHQVWLPPLADPPTLDALMPPRALDPERGLNVQVPELQGTLHAVIGIVDRPLDQRRDPVWWELAGSAGHAVVVGGPASGKSTVLRSLILSLALTHTPREAQFYCLDFGGGALGSLRDVPHVGGIATRLDPGAVRRTIAELQVLLAERERRFATAAIDSMGTYRRARRAGRHADDPFGDVFLVIDGWSTIRQDFEDLEPAINDLTNRGLTYGVHVIATATRWMDIRPAIRDLFGSRLELRLGDASDSAIDRRAAMNVPERTPGRGIVPGGLQFLAALPRADGGLRPVPDGDASPDRPGPGPAEDLADGVEKLVLEIRSGWTAPGAPPVRLLPALLPYESLPVTDKEMAGIPIGIAESDLRPVWIDLSTDPHFLLFGDSASGKSAFLRAFGQAVADRYTLTEARIIVVDYRRSLLGAFETEHLIGTGTSAETAQAIMTEVVQVLKDRLPGPDVTIEQLRKRTWWKGPELYVLVDDYDLVAGGSTNPIAPLLDFLSQARDVGLHLILTRRTGGASRALYEQILMRLRELGSPGVLLSGERDEGALLGNVRPSHQPPGRGYLVTRKEGGRLIQLAWRPPPG
ncbi:type VII secretion protein EccCa [Dactylosporangium roseum]|uniref:Type VII secretion protein EccCa n=1 Tax=Dactylosporangium roseum TaxID=47989 RepID=A0ABY5ZBE2_9ACTN|nr:type VII secretion protein EccCa [Dactylosporangium roseum]UWZ38911.1 type VII secretion protein EccCa [Dactylosporangium roseum]